MKINIKIKMCDIAQLLFRAKVMTTSAKVLFIIIFVFSMLASLSPLMPAETPIDITTQDIFSHVATGCVLALGISLLFIGFVALCYVPYFFMLKSMPGILGLHVYAIEESGFREETDFGMMFTKWKGIKSVEKNKHSILISIGDMLYHVIPRRDFSDEKAYRDFYYSIRQYLDEAKQG